MGQEQLIKEVCYSSDGKVVWSDILTKEEQELMQKSWMLLGELQGISEPNAQAFINQALVLAKMPLHQLRLMGREDWLFAFWELWVVHFYWQKLDEESICPLIKVDQDRRIKQMQEEYKQGVILNRPRGWTTVSALPEHREYGKTIDNWVNNKLDRIGKALEAGSSSEEISLYSICTPLIGRNSYWPLVGNPKRWWLYAALFARMLQNPPEWFVNSINNTSVQENSTTGLLLPNSKSRSPLYLLTDRLDFKQALLEIALQSPEVLLELFPESPTKQQQAEILAYFLEKMPVEFCKTSSSQKSSEILYGHKHLFDRSRVVGAVYFSEKSDLSPV